jgi:hypothetical protein
MVKKVATWRVNKYVYQLHHEEKTLKSYFKTWQNWIGLIKKWRGLCIKEANGKWDISAFTEVANQKRVNVCEYMGKMPPHDSFKCEPPGKKQEERRGKENWGNLPSSCHLVPSLLFIHIHHPLLLNKDLCECQTVSIIFFLCSFICVHQEISSFLVRFIHSYSYFRASVLQ